MTSSLVECIKLLKTLLPPYNNSPVFRKPRAPLLEILLARLRAESQLIKETIKRSALRKEMALGISLNHAKYVYDG